MINHSIIFRNCFLRDSINADWPSLWTEERNSYPARFHGEPTVSWCCPPTSTTPLSCKWTLAPGANQHCGLIGTRWTRRQMIGRPVRWPSVSKEHSNWGKPGMPEIQEHDKDSEKTGKTYLVLYLFIFTWCVEVRGHCQTHRVSSARFCHSWSSELTGASHHFGCRWSPCNCRWWKP